MIEKMMQEFNEDINSGVVVTVTLHRCGVDLRMRQESGTRVLNYDQKMSNAELVAFHTNTDDIVMLRLREMMLRLRGMMKVMREALK